MNEVCSSSALDSIASSLVIGFEDEVLGDGV